MSSAPMFGKDHNQPPAAVELARADIRERLEAYRQRVADLLTSIRSYKMIRDRVDAGQVADLLGFTKSVLELIERDRKHAAAPYDEAVGAVRNEVERFVSDLVEAAAALRERGDKWADEEDARIKAQELEQIEHERKLRQQQSEAAGRPAPPVAIAPPPVRAKRRTIQGDFGNSMSIGSEYVIAIDDWRALPDFVFDAEPVQQAIRALLMPLVRKKVPISGTTVTTQAKTTVRRA